MYRGLRGGYPSFAGKLRAPHHLMLDYSSFLITLRMTNNNYPDHIQIPSKRRVDDPTRLHGISFITSAESPKSFRCLHHLNTQQREVELLKSGWRGTGVNIIRILSCRMTENLDRSASSAVSRVTSLFPSLQATRTLHNFSVFVLVMRRPMLPLRSYHAPRWLSPNGES